MALAPNVSQRGAGHVAAAVGRSNLRRLRELGRALPIRRALSEDLELLSGYAHGLSMETEYNLYRLSLLRNGAGPVATFSRMSRLNFSTASGMITADRAG